jgi:hypothetical protein
MTIRICTIQIMSDDEQFDSLHSLRMFVIDNRDALELFALTVGWHIRICHHLINPSNAPRYHTLVENFMSRNYQ